ncbi:N-acetyltransferase B complex non catalytic subunit-domain-containing protein [Hypoxylon crocopeplum]|nr:N-acetyltransferase B complex non catalytic subunit-domain-containing protein [Hypoxylon crocopeplum]
MKPPLIPPGKRPISLKHSTPNNIQSAFAEEQWVTAANLAKQRYRATKDSYYLALEVAAKSQSDNVADRNGGKVAVEAMIKDNVTLTDIDTLDLYEMACHRPDVKYSETVGILRARLVKALPRDQSSGTRCFDACVWNGDWKNAQQIGASLNTTFLNDRKFLFRYILATHQYSLSRDCPEGSKKLFTSLAKAQADKAFDFRVMTHGSEYSLDRAANTECEAQLWLGIRIAHCSPKENLALFRKPEYSPLAFLDIGQLEPFWASFTYLIKQQAWGDALRIGKTIWTEAIRISQAEALAVEKDKEAIRLQKLVDNEAEPNPRLQHELAHAQGMARPARSYKDHNYMQVCCEYNLFIALYDAARFQSDCKRELKQAGHLADRLVKALTRAGTMQPIYRKMYEMFKLGVTAGRDSVPSPQLASGGLPSRISSVVDYISKSYDDGQCVHNAMVFTQQFTALENIVFLDAVCNIPIKDGDDAHRRYALTCVHLRLRYFMATTRRYDICASCGGASCGDELTDNGYVLKGSGCISCLKSIAASALEAYKSCMRERDLVESMLPTRTMNPFSDLAVIGSICLVKIARIRGGRFNRQTNSLFGTDTQLFLQAVLWLETAASTSKRCDAHTVLLTKLYLLMGCVSRAKTFWDGFDVKNALIDSLGMTFADRLSSIAPGYFIGSDHDNPVAPFVAHFARAFKTTVPKRIMDSLDVGNYEGVQSMMEFSAKQAGSCSLVLAVIEERRGQRMKTGKIEASLDDQPLVRKLSIEHDLEDVTDYGVFSIPLLKEWQMTGPIHEVVNYGPLPTTTRAHLGLLAERFLDFVCYVQPKEYKPTKSGQVTQIDWKHALNTCNHLEQDMSALLGLADERYSVEEQERRGKESTKSLTESEYLYHQMILKLALTAQSVLEHAFVSTPTNGTREHIRGQIAGVLRILKRQTSDFLEVPSNMHSKLHGLHGFASLHAMGMLHGTIIAVKHTTNYLTTATEKAKNADKTRPPAELAWLTPELKKLTAAAAESEDTIKGRIKMLIQYLDNVDGWRDRLRHWTLTNSGYFRDRDLDFKQKVADDLCEIVPDGHAESWADRVGESWRELMKGWAAVRFD